MNDLGETLKDARIKKGYDIEDVHRITKIQKRYLEAIEAGNLDALPGHFYARAFVKSYAEAVGLDPGIVLEQINSTDLPQAPIEELNVPLRRTKQERSPIQSGRRLSRVLLYSFAVLILFVIYFAAMELKQSSPQEEALPPNTQSPAPNQAATPPGLTEQPAQPPPATEQPPAPQDSTPKPTLTYLAREGNTYRYELTGAQTFDISITAKGNCWMRLQKDGINGPKVEEITLNAGSTKQWTVSDTSVALLRLGAAPDVTIQVNGQGLDTSMMTRSSQMISITLKP